MNKAILKRNLSFSVGSNAISLLVSALMILCCLMIMAAGNYICSTFIIQAFFTLAGLMGCICVMVAVTMKI